MTSQQGSTTPRRDPGGDKYSLHHAVDRRMISEPVMRSLGANKHVTILSDRTLIE